MKNDKNTDKELTPDERRELEKLRRYRNNRIKIKLISFIISSVLLAVAALVLIVGKIVR